MLEIKWQPSRRELRQFAGIWLPLFAGLAGSVFVYRSGRWDIAIAIWGVAAAIAVAGVIQPRFVKPLFVGLMLATYPIGWTISHLVLAVIYYGLFTAVGLLMRVFRYDPLNRRRATSLTSYWTKHDHRSEPETYFRQF